MKKTLYAPVTGVLKSRCCQSVIAFLVLFSGLQSLPLLAAKNDKSLTLGAAISRTIQQNPTLKVFEFRDAAMQGQMQSADLKPALELGVETENFAGSNELSGFDSAELTVSLSSVIELGSKREARTGFVSRNRSLLAVEKQLQSLDLLGEVTRRYIDVLAAQERVGLAMEAAELSNIALDVVKKRARVGSTPEAEVKRASAAAAQSALTLMSERRQLQYLKVALAMLWGEKNPGFSKVEGDLYQFGESIDFNSLYAKVAQNPAVQIFAAQERLQDAEVRLAKTESTANLSWSVGLRQLQESNDTALVAGFSMPLFSGKRNKGAVVTALAERNEIFVQKKIALLEIYTQLFRAFNNRQQAVDSVKRLQSEIVPALEQALEETQQAYQRGRYSYLEYVGARQETLSARRTLIEAASAALMFGATIEQLTAEPLTLSPQKKSLK